MGTILNFNKTIRLTSLWYKQYYIGKKKMLSIIKKSNLILREN